MSTPHPGPARPGPWLRPGPPAPVAAAPPVGGGPGPRAATGGSTGGTDPLAGLRDLPVARHADLLADEHDRLHRLLATIDQL